MEDLLNTLSLLPRWKTLLEKVVRNEPLFVIGGNEGFWAMISASLQKHSKKKVIVVCSGPEQADNFYSTATTFFPETEYFPERETHLPFGDTIETKEILRARVLADTESDNRLIITHATAFFLRLPSPEKFSISLTPLTVNTPFPRDTLIQKLLASGYEETDVVNAKGEFARRGGIIDFHPFAEETPIRIEFLSNRIVSIRTFDPATQRSLSRLSSYRLAPLSEDLASNKKESLLTDYIKNSLLLFCNPDLFSTAISRTQSLATPFFKQDFLSEEEILSLQSRAISFSSAPSAHFHTNLLFFPAETPTRFGFIKEHFIWDQFPKEKVYLFEDTGRADDIKKILQDHSINKKSIFFKKGYISHSFTIPEANITVLSDTTFFGHSGKKSTRFFSESIPVSDQTELKPGDYLVHFEEGIGKFRGFEKVKGFEEELLVMEFAEKSQLKVPVSQISFIHKYIGNIPHPKLSKIGSKTWKRTRDTVREEIKNLALELSKLYIERKQRKGIAAAPDDEMQKMVEDLFPFEETEGQILAMKEIKQDLESDRIMDRLLCGDSGYGKTELALRAAFKVICSGRQVALLCPTTVLAQQHYHTFKERFASFPVQVEMLSRISSPAKNRKVRKGLSQGTVDMVIGTHAILSKQSSFQNLGLLIIDEEQRFGVLQKERLARRFPAIELLILSATPIPRTLHFALSGVRDLSLLETAPPGRLSVFTLVAPYDTTLITRAIEKELERKGQVFFLHNRIHDIEKVAHTIQKFFPSASVGIAHGKVREQTLAATMESFRKGKIDILVATSIVENGLDIPNANTLIVNNAHLFGLSDLYQLRGRVGRYKVRAYAYFLIPPHGIFTNEAKERLKTLKELVRPGSGFKVAMADLHIRGAGDILGKRQHGFINQVGFHLYCQFWQEVSATFSGKTVLPAKEEPRLKGIIDPNWLPSPGLRLTLYQEISDITSLSQAKELIKEMEDRFGEVPQEVKKMILTQSNKGGSSSSRSS
ncbi:MAG: DEAD/DEAH box helicase [Candidatus Ratteibacteria bacterium]|jgi:transcription-repair coupling factor (superfamily II helicase)